MLRPRVKPKGDPHGDEIVQINRKKKAKIIAISNSAFGFLLGMITGKTNSDAQDIIRRGSRKLPPRKKANMKDKTLNPTYKNTIVSDFNKVNHSAKRFFVCVITRGL